MAELYRTDYKSDRKLDELTENMISTRQRLVGLEQDARQSRLAMEADVPTGTKIRKRTEAAAADQAKHGDSCSAKRVDAGPPMCLTSFGDDSTEPSALPCRDDVMVDKGAAAPTPRLSPVEMRTPIATGGLLRAGTAATAIRTMFSLSFPSWTLREETKENKSRTNNNQLAPFCRRKDIQMNSRQTHVFDPGGYLGRLRGCLFLGERHA